MVNVVSKLRASQIGRRREIHDEAKQRPRCKWSLRERSLLIACACCI